MRRRTAARAVAWACVAGLAVAPTVLVSAEFVLGDVHLSEAVIGAAIGSSFFAVTAIATVMFQNSPLLPKVVLTTYVIKTALLCVVFSTLSFGEISRAYLGASTVSAALAYLATQTVLISRAGGSLRESSNEMAEHRPVLG